MTEEKRTYLKRFDNLQLFNKKICKECGGYCCMQQACMIYPFDIFPFESHHIINLIENGYYEIRATFELEKVYPYLICREINHNPIAILSPHNQCSHLGVNGCCFCDEDRPTGAITLIPKTDYNCVSVNDLNHFFDLWKDSKIQNEMHFVTEYYLGNKKIDSYCKSLFSRFEASLFDNTCTENFMYKYITYSKGIQFGYNFNPKIKNFF